MLVKPYPQRIYNLVKGFIDTQIIMAQGRVWLSRNVLGVCRNDVSRLVGNCRKKMLFVLPNTLSSECGMWTGRISILWEPAQYANSQTPDWLTESSTVFGRTASQSVSTCWFLCMLLHGADHCSDSITVDFWFGGREWGFLLNILHNEHISLLCVW